MDTRPLALIAFLVTIAARWVYLSNRDGRWVSGVFSKDQTMKRWTGTHWECRPMTKAEAWEDMDSRIW